jgi:MFS family permease
MKLSKQNSKTNFKAFVWHSAFLAFAANFMDVNTILPSMLIKIGGTPILLGLLTTILIGGSSITQLLFAGFLLNKPLKKKYLLAGINMRILALLGISFLFYNSAILSKNVIIFLVFLLISIFSLSGAFANVSYIAILGRAIKKNKRKKFFSVRQIFNSIGILISALVVRELIKYYKFPSNYAIIFLSASLLLAIASLGFWRIKEVHSTVRKKKKFLKFLKLIPTEIRKNKNLKYYLLITNTLGIGLSIIPFLILFAKENFQLSFNLIGNFLLFNTLGMLIAGLILFKYSEKFNYKSLLKSSIILSSSLPIIALLLMNTQFIYQFIFIISGSFIAIYGMSISGLLLEISNKENRITYAGISGAGSIIPLIFPLLTGFLIPIIGYKIIFVAVSIIILTSLIFVSKLKCKLKPTQNILIKSKLNKEINS